MKIFRVILSIALLCAARVNGADPEVLKAQAMTCATEGSILTLVMSMDPVKIFKESPKVVPCFTACMLRENNIMDQNGKIDSAKFFEITVDKLGPSFKKDKIKKMFGDQIAIANKEADGCAVLKKLLINCVVKSWTMIYNLLS